MAILTVGIDLAKNVFALHGVNEAGNPELQRPKVARAKLNEVVAALAPCTIGIEACSGAHHWAREFAKHGHTVKLMAPKLVTPYRMTGKRGKNDAADAAAICEAVQRPNMRFVPIKSEEQQSRRMVHRARQGYVQTRTALINRVRGLMSEFGIVLPQKAQVVRRDAALHLEELRCCTCAPRRPPGPHPRRHARPGNAPVTSPCMCCDGACRPWTSMPVQMLEMLELLVQMAGRTTRSAPRPTAIPWCTTNRTSPPHALSTPPPSRATGRQPACCIGSPEHQPRQQKTRASPPGNP